MEIETREIMGYEGLSRGPRGSDARVPDATCSGVAARFGLTEELERACRRQVFVDWEVFGCPERGSS